MVLIFDCETGDLKHRRLLQLACILKDANFRDVASVSLLVKPVDFEIDPEAEKVHGISREKAMACGLPVEVIIGIFCGLAMKCKTFVGHNLDFDMGVVEGEMRRLGWPSINRERFCTQAAMTSVVKIPPTEKMKRAGRHGYKSPKLIEAYQHAFGESFDGAHDAMADCRATAKLFMWLKKVPVLMESAVIEGEMLKSLVTVHPPTGFEQNYPPYQLFQPPPPLPP